MLWLVGLMLWACSGCVARGQGCGLSMIPEYTAYASTSIVGNTINTSVTVQGYAVIFPSAGCNLQGVTHQGRAYNKISNTGGWVYGPNVCPSCFISVSNNQSLSGALGGTYPFSWQGVVYCSKAGVMYTDGANSNISLVTAVISTRSSNSLTVSPSDSAGPNYGAEVGTLKLGPIIETGQLKGCGVGLETVGTVTPSNTAVTVIIRRVIVQQGLYVNSTPQLQPPPASPNSDDTSLAEFQDDNPQNSSPPGTVYDLDGPSEIPNTISNNTYRYRTNFYEYASLADGTQISPLYYYSVNLSCAWYSPGRVFVYDVAGDNQLVTGSTPITWNLQ